MTKRIEPLQATHPTRCALCGRRVRRGEPIRYTDPFAKRGQARRWAHAECQTREAAA